MASPSSTVRASSPPASRFEFNASPFSRVHIGISGLIGAGKTTLALALGKKLDIPVYKEPVIDNTYLKDFYTDMKKYAFPMQIYLLQKRFEQQQQIIWSGRGGVQDRTIYEDGVFAKMLCDSGCIDERDYATYRALFGSMANFMKKPSMIVHLDLSPEESLRRIGMRNRDCESGITLEYLTALSAAYDEFLQDISKVIPVLKVSYDEFRDVDEVADKIKMEYERMACIIDIPAEPKPALFPPADDSSAEAEDLTSMEKAGGGVAQRSSPDAVSPSK